MRVLVTGCRDWTDKGEVWCALDTVVDDNHGLCMRDQGIQLVVGDCKTGADEFARQWVADNKDGLEPEVYSAEWNRHGMAAGPKRNTKMVDSGADICLAFWDGHSPGTRDCIQKAVRAGIPVRIYPMCDGERRD